MTSPEYGSDAAALEAALADCVSLVESSGWSAVDEYLSTHTDMAPAIEVRLTALVDLGMIEARDASGRPDHPDHLGGFRLVERLGGGGMGVVFRAEQEDLGREVALKLMRPDHLYFEGARERFRREAAAVARLQHSGIVPVYAFGEEGGLPYFAMELVEGRTLAETVGPREGDDRTLTTEEIASHVHLVAEIADALEHAHARGVLHRDVKPSNVIVTATGRAMLIDFGLARMEGQSRITRSGAVTGSLPYVAPEILRDEGPGWTEQCDVYSLGITLYELLTGACPYLEASAEGTRRRIVDGRPESVRRRQPRVSRELEVVCLKAMDRDPSRRYRSAADLARDLRNVLERRPIEARAPGLVLATRRWVRRHPTLTASMMLVALLLAAVPAALLMQAKEHQAELQDSLEEVTRAREAEARERERAEEKATAATEAMLFVVGVFAEGGAYRSGGEPANALDLVRIGVKRARDELVEVPAVRAFILFWLGRTLIELEENVEAAALLEETVELVKDRTDQRLLHGRALLGLATTAIEMDDMARATRLVNEAEPLLVGERGGQIGAARLAEGRVALAEERWADAEEHLVAAFELYRGDPQTRPYELAAVRGNIAIAQQGQGRLAEAIAMNRESLAELRRNIDRPHPAIARVLDSLGRMLKLSGKPEEAERCYRESIEIATACLGEENLTLANTRHNLGALVFQRGDADAAHVLYTAARRTYEAHLPENHRSRVECLASLAAVNGALGRHADNVAMLPRVIELQCELEGPEHAKVAYTRVHLAQAFMHMGRFDDAMAPLRSVVATKNPAAANPAVKAHQLLGAIHFQRGRVKEAAATIQRGIEYIDAHREHLPAAEWPAFRKMMVGLLERLKAQGGGG